MTDTPIRVGKFTLIPVVHSYLYSHHNSTQHCVIANKEPRAVIVCDIDAVYAFDLTSNRITIASLAEKIPNLNELLMPHLPKQSP